MLPFFELSLKHAQTKATKHSPFQILYGRSPRTPIDFAKEGITQAVGSTVPSTPLFASRWAKQWEKSRKKLWRFIKRNQLQVASDMKRRYDKGRRPMLLELGDMVLLSTQSHAVLTGIRKHKERYVGPYIVDHRVHDNAYSLRGLPPGVPTTQNVQYLRLFLPSPARFATRPHADYAKPHHIDGQTEWEVEKILDHKVYLHGHRYRVKWKDTPLEQWLSEWNLENCKRLLREYHQQHQLPMTPFLTNTEGESSDSTSDDQEETDSQLNPFPFITDSSAIIPGQPPCLESLYGIIARQ